MINYEKVKFTGLSPELRGPRIGLSAVKTELQCGLAEMDAVSPESAERDGSGLLLPADEIIRFTEVKATVISNPGIRKETNTVFPAQLCAAHVYPGEPGVCVVSGGPVAEMEIVGRHGSTGQKGQVISLRRRMRRVEGACALLKTK